MKKYFIITKEVEFEDLSHEDKLLNKRNFNSIIAVSEDEDAIKTIYRSIADELMEDYRDGFSTIRNEYHCIVKDYRKTYYGWEYVFIEIKIEVVIGV